MKKNIEDIDDIKLLVNSFYSKVRNNEIIGYIFSDVAKVNWKEHLPRMYSFWETVLLGKISFKGNPIIKHIALNEKVTLTNEHFEQWVQLWCSTIDELFTGRIAESAKSKAALMKTLMLGKIECSNKQLV